MRRGGICLISVGGIAVFSEGCWLMGRSRGFSGDWCFGVIFLFIFVSLFVDVVVEIETIGSVNIDSYYFSPAVFISTTTYSHTPPTPTSYSPPPTYSYPVSLTPQSD